MRIGTHATLATGRQLRQFWPQPSVLVKEFFRVITLHPILKHPQVVGLFCKLRERHLMRAKRALDLSPIHKLWARPTFWCAQNNHRPARALLESILARLSLN